MVRTSGDKVLIFGGAGRVGFALAGALIQQNTDVVVVDCIDPQRLSEMAARLMIDARLMSGDSAGSVTAYGDVDVLDQDRITEILAHENPSIVVNYAIPFTWDASKQLANYQQISAAGLGAFAAVQVLAPKIIAQALSASESEATYVVGNLPDITIPILYGLKQNLDLVLPIGGAGNVGLIERALKHQIAAEHQLPIKELTVHLVAHHIHWVAPREPGYPNDAPFMFKASRLGHEITDELGDPRELMNRAIVNCYEAGAGFSSTTALLAAELVTALLSDNASTKMHIPAPNGLPGGYPVEVKHGQVSLNLPDDWSLPDALNCMQKAHQRDGINSIGDDGSIHFNPESVAILKKEVGIVLPEVLTPGDLETVAKEQIRVAQRAIGVY